MLSAANLSTEIIKKPQKRTTLAEVEVALRSTNGNLYMAAKMLGITRDAIYKRMRDYPKLKEIVEQSREGMIDIAESKLREAIFNGEPWAIALTLKTIGKTRGYVERVENNNMLDANVSISLNLPHNERDVVDKGKNIIDV